MWVVTRLIIRSQRDRVRVAFQHLGGSFLQRIRRNKNQTRETGQNLVEFAIVLPLLLLFIFGAVDLGRLFHAYIAITNAAREGARFGGLNRDMISGIPPNETCSEPLEDFLLVDKDIIFVACSEGRTSGIDISRMTVTPSCPDGCDAFKSVFVTVSYNFDFLLGNFIPVLPGVFQVQIKFCEELLR